MALIPLFYNEIFDYRFTKKKILIKSTEDIKRATTIRFLFKKEKGDKFLFAYRFPFPPYLPVVI